MAGGHKAKLRKAAKTNDEQNFPGKRMENEQYER